MSLLFYAYSAILYYGKTFTFACLQATKIFKEGKEMLGQPSNFFAKLWK